MITGRHLVPALTACATILILAAGPASAQVEVHLNCECAEPVHVVVVAEAGSGTTVEIETVAPGVSQLPLEPGKVWTVQAEGMGVWAPPLTEYITSSDRRFDLQLDPASEIRCRLHVPEGEKIPGEITIVSSPRAGHSGAVRRSCGVSSSGGVSCQLPRGVADVKIRAPGFLSVFKWGVTVGDEPLDLGDLRLEPGASVVVAVVGSTGDPVPDATVTLERPGGGGDGLRQKTNDRGVAVFEQVAVGVWNVTAAKEGLAGGAAIPIRVLERAEASLRAPLVLARAVTLDVSVEPARDPTGLPWRVALHEVGRDGPLGELAPEQATDEGGWAHFSSLKAGEAELTVWDGTGGLWHAETLSLTTTPPPLQVTLTGVDVVGRVVDAPEKSWRFVRWRTAGEGAHRSAKAPLGEDRTFVLSLPREGRWKVHLETRGGLATAPVDVSIEKPPPHEVVELELEFSSLSIVGRVLDHHGEPVERVSVTASLAATGDQQELDSVAVLTDGNGRFEVPGVWEGETWLVASAPDGRQATETVQVDAETGAEVEIRLPRGAVLRGQTLLDGRPAAGVAVQAMCPGAGAVRIEPVRSNGHGRFEIRLPEATLPALVAVPQAGGMLLAQATSLEHEVILQLPSVAGELEVSWDSTKVFSPILRATGRGLPILLLAILDSGRGASFSTDRALLPALAPGQYEVCAAPIAGVNQGTGPRCELVDVLPFARVSVELGG